MIDRTIESALWRLTGKLRGKVAGPRRQEIRRQLRADLHSTATVVGAEEAVCRLGDLDALAAEYAEAERGQPPRRDPIGGVAAAAITLLVLALLNGRRVMSFTLKDHGDFDPWRVRIGLPDDTLTLLSLSGDVERDLLLVIRIDQLAYLIFPALAFIIAGRIWRGWNHPSAPNLTAAG